MCIDETTTQPMEDPPTQANVYITPGAERQETYSLLTFDQLPNACPVAPTKFASAGFYYTGFRNRVKCFSCGLCVESWKTGDDPSDKEWYSGIREFANGIDTTSQSMRGVFSKFRALPPSCEYVLHRVEGP